MIFKTKFYVLIFFFKKKKILLPKFTIQIIFKKSLKNIINIIIMNQILQKIIL